MTPEVAGPDRLAMALTRELRSGERVLWQGGQLARVSKKAFGIYLFAIPWTAFALFWTAMASFGASALQSETGFLSWAFPLFGVPFVVVGLAMLSAPFMPLWRKGKVLFAITDQRLIELKLRSSLDIKSVPARRIGMIERNETRDGGGTLKIAVKVGTDSDGDRHTEYFELGEVNDVLTAHDKAAFIGKSAAERSGGG